jgi:hypothetical protein
VTQLVLHLHKCATEPLHAATNPTTAESTAEPLYSPADPATTGAALTDISCLSV